LQTQETAPLNCEGKISIFKEDLVNSPEKWTTTDEGIQYLRELAVLEVYYRDLDDDEVSEDPKEVLRTQAMSKKVIQSTPASYSNSLAAIYCPNCGESIFLAPKLCRKSLYLPIPTGQCLGSQGPPKKSVLCCPSQREREPQMHAVWCALVFPA